MEPILDRVCGLDVHRGELTACVLIAEAKGTRVRKMVRRYRTFTQELRDLGDWLITNGVTHVGLESTGVYWRPVYAVLEARESFELIVGNAQHMKNVPGRKTDMNDAEWIARLVRMGLIRKSYVPPPDLRDLRELVRLRDALIDARVSERNRTVKILNSANVKLSSVATDVFGVSGMAMLRALARGEADPKTLASLAKGKLRDKTADLALALEGSVTEAVRINLRLQLKRLADTEADIATLDAEIAKRMAPYAEEVTLLSTIPGIKETVAAVIIAEAGPTFAPFPSERHLAAWAGVAPGNNESAGKRHPAGARKGNVYLASALVEAANAASRKKNSYFREKFLRLKARRGHKRAMVAIAHKMLVAAYHVLTKRQAYKELGLAYLDSLERERVAKRLMRRLHSVGYDVAVVDRETGEQRAITSVTTT